MPAFAGMTNYDTPSQGGGNFVEGEGRVGGIFAWFAPIPLADYIRFQLHSWSWITYFSWPGFRDTKIFPSFMIIWIFFLSWRTGISFNGFPSTAMISANFPASNVPVSRRKKRGTFVQSVLEKSEGYFYNMSHAEISSLRCAAGFASCDGAGHREKEDILRGPRSKRFSFSSGDAGRRKVDGYLRLGLASQSLFMLSST